MGYFLRPEPDGRDLGTTFTAPFLRALLLLCDLDLCSAIVRYSYLRVGGGEPLSRGYMIFTVSPV